MNARKWHHATPVRICNFVTYCLLLLAATRAHASVATNYVGGNYCIAQSSSDASNWDLGDSNSLYSLTDGLKIVCPILKATSGPLVSSGDAITAVSINVDNAGTTAVKCQLSVYNSQIVSQSPSAVTNFVSAAGPYSDTSDAYLGTISFPSVVSNTDCWGTSATWLYGELECVINNGQQLFDYTITEAGSNTGARTAPGFAYCSAMSGTTAGTEYTNMADGGGTTHGPEGYMEAGGGAGFFYDCKTPGLSIQFSMKPSINTTGWAWSYSSSGPFTTMEPGSYKASPDWPSQNFPGATSTATGHTATNGFLDTSSTSDVFLKQGTSGGDMGFTGLRLTGL